MQTQSLLGGQKCQLRKFFVPLDRCDLSRKKTVVNSESKSFFFSRLGPESSLMGERRHKDEVDSADDSDGGRAEQEEVEI